MSRSTRRDHIGNDFDRIHRLERKRKEIENGHLMTNEKLEIDHRAALVSDLCQPSVRTTDHRGAERYTSGVAMNQPNVCVNRVGADVWESGGKVGEPSRPKWAPASGMRRRWAVYVYFDISQRREAFLGRPLRRFRRPNGW